MGRHRDKTTGHQRWWLTHSSVSAEGLKFSVFMATTLARPRLTVSVADLTSRSKRQAVAVGLLTLSGGPKPLSLCRIRKQQSNRWNQSPTALLFLKQGRKS
jgi:hypothetical protein